MKYTGWYEMKNVFNIIKLEGMPGIRPSLKTGNNIINRT
jgi:hypothetical protein